MKRLFVALLFLCFGCCGVVCAQSFNMQTDRENITSLDGLWHFHTGDDPRWADPKFDDSQWTLLRSDEDWAAQGYQSYRLTFMSDGVVEAQTTSGELFGFARTGELSRESAGAIAHAAQQFGQQDDITVVTMEFLGVPSEALA